MTLPIDTPIEFALIFLIFVILLAIIGYLRYPGSAEMMIRISDKLKFVFKGKKKSEVEPTKQGGVDIEKGAHIQAKDIIGRDKYETYVQPESPPKLLPDLQLYVFDRNEGLKKESTVNQSSGETPIDISFLLRLVNEAKGTFPKGIGINLEFSDRRENPSKEIKFYRPAASSRWKTHRVNISGSLPAHFSFTDPDLICYPGQPVHDVQFRFRLPERSSGHILGQYTVSSHDPESERKGEIKVYFE